MTMSSTSTMTSTSSSPSGSTLRMYSTTLSSPMPTSPRPSSSLSTASDADINANNVNGNAAPTSSTAIPTLRSMYPRAARSLLQKDFALTYSLIESAFAVITRPRSAAVDELDTHRRKWDILRITLETSVYAAPPRSSDPNALPPALRSTMMLTAPSLVASMHARSVQLYTPTPSLPGGPSGSQSNSIYATKPRLEFLPAQILVTLALSALKLSCPEVSRAMIEDWLAQRQRLREELQYASADEEGPDMHKEGYVKVLDLYCLHVLPRLHDWEYARDFLAYESELEPGFRKSLQAHLEALRIREIENARTIPTPPALASSSVTPNYASPARTPSPAPSDSSGSSLDTNGTHSTRTVVPRTSRAKQGINGLGPLTPTSSTNGSNSKLTNGHANGHANSKAEGSVVSATSASTIRGVKTRTTLEDTSHVHTVSTRTPTALTLFKAYLRPHLTTSNLVFAALFVLVPLLSFFLRLRRRRAKLPSTGSVTPARIGSSGSITGSVNSGQGRMSADEVRRRLRASEGGGKVLGMAWREVYRAVVDAVRMAGSGLV